MTKPWSAARNFAARPSALLQYMKPKQRHQEKRLGIAGDQEERRRMRDDGEGAEKLQEWRDIPAIAKEKKITPETPGRGLGRDQQRVVGAQVQTVTEQRREGGVSREKRHVGDLHHLVAARRNGGAVTAVHDIREPVAIVLDERVVTKGKRALAER